MDEFLKWLMPTTQKEETLKGGEGSGNFGHKGRPGKRGGSGGGKVSGGVWGKIKKTLSGEYEYEPVRFSKNEPKREPSKVVEPKKDDNNDPNGPVAGRDYYQY